MAASELTLNSFKRRV